MEKMPSSDLHTYRFELCKDQLSPITLLNPDKDQKAPIPIVVVDRGRSLMEVAIRHINEDLVFCTLIMRGRMFRVYQDGEWCAFFFDTYRVSARDNVIIQQGGK